MNYGQWIRYLSIGVLSSLMINAFAGNPQVMNADRQQAKTPKLVLERLKAGNQRFVVGQLKNHDFLEQANATSGAQHPVAVILNCMDARTPPEIVFDQGIGDIFAIRIAGNIQNNDILGSIEFGTKLAGAKLIVVMGHTNCGAMRGACQQAKLGHLTELLDKIQPVIQKMIKPNTPLNCSSNTFVDNIAKNNVLSVIKEIQMNSPVVSKLVEDGNVGIIGALQDLNTGKVTFFEDAAIFPKNAYVKSNQTKEVL